jgi:SAM-dependent MidA family methyltransferase
LNLKEIIIQEIRKRGGITFRDFMEMALYYPELGYYSSPGEKIGKYGDYFTSSDVGPVFGELLCIQLMEIWRLLGGDDFAIVETGAGKGHLCRDILNYAARNEKFSKSLEYIIVERSPHLRRRQEEYLKDPRIRWTDSIEDLAVEGCFISNEVVDSFPVHLVEMKEGKLREVYLDYRGGFIEELREPSDPRLIDYFSKLGVKLKEGFRTEVNLEATEWIRQIGDALKRGFVITIDYGYPSEELYSPARSRGTLMCYYKHTVSDNPYHRIGRQDITSHVNFSALVYWGRLSGLELTGLTDQSHFIIGLAEQYFKELEGDYMDYLHKLLQVKRLIIPEEMGSVFKVLVQHKNVENPQLSGLKFSASISF